MGACLELSGIAAIPGRDWWISPLLRYDGSMKLPPIREQALRRMRRTRDRLWAEKLDALRARQRSVDAPVVPKKTAKRPLMQKERQWVLDLMGEMRRISDQAPPVMRGMTEFQVIQKMRETRERLWEKKIAALGSRR